MMVLSTPVKLAAISVALLLPGVSGIEDPEDGSYTYDMEKVFDIILKPNSDGTPLPKGNCVEWADRVTTSYNQALDILQKGMEASERLEKTPVPARGEKMPIRVGKERTEWLYKAMPYDAM